MKRLLLVPLALTILATGVLTGCSEDFLVEDPPHVLVAENLYQSPAGFEAALNGLYSRIRGERWGFDGSNNERFGIYTVGTDNVFGNQPDALHTRLNLWNASFNSTWNHNEAMWEWLYRTINGANTIIERAENPDIAWTEAQKNEAIAEARFIRAWAYRHLTYLWGDVPLNLEESSGETIRTDWTLTPQADVFKQIEQDLLFAEQHLPNLPSNPGKVGKAAAQHYLAEVYLHPTMNKPAESEKFARKVIDNPNYKLITERYGVQRNNPYGCAFLDQFIEGNSNRSEGNTEALWVFQYELDVPGGAQTMSRRAWGQRYYNNKGIKISEEFGGRGLGREAPTVWALNLYEKGDDRGTKCAIRDFYLYNDAPNLPAGKKLGDTLWIKIPAKDVLRQNNWPTTRKWEVANPTDVTGSEQYNDQVYLRLAETYLLLAEALHRQGKNQEAADVINVLRARAHATPITAGQVNIDFILDERSRELLAEEQRRYTLLRTGKWLERVRAYNGVAGPVIQDFHVLFPIPQTFIDANKDNPIPQNQGYS